MVLIATKIFLCLVGVELSATAKVRFMSGDKTEGFILYVMALIGMLLGVFL